MMERTILILLAPLLALAALVAAIRYAYSIVVTPAKARRIAIAFDQLANAAANGHEDETISSRANRARLAGRSWGCVLCRFLDLFEKDHCAKSAGT